MQATLIIVFALLGTSIGSFLNVVIYRLPRRKPFWRWGERSYCPNCKKTLQPKDLIPILSFVILRGKCRHCKKHISWQYIIVEVFTAVAFGVSASVFGLSLELLYALVLLSLAIPLFVIDGRHKVIPDALSIPFIVLALAIGLFSGLEWYSPFLGAAIGASFFALQWFVSKGKWIGSGDIRVGAAMGALLGWKYVFAALVVSYLLGTVYSIVLMIVQKKKLGSTIAFGPFLVLGMLIVYFWGAQIVDWYFNAYWLIDKGY